MPSLGVWNCLNCPAPVDGSEWGLLKRATLVALRDLQPRRVWYVPGGAFSLYGYNITRSLGPERGARGLGGNQSSVSSMR